MSRLAGFSFFGGVFLVGLGVSTFLLREKFFGRSAEFVSCELSRESRIVRGSSMEPIFFPGETIYALIGWYGCHSPKKDEIALVSFAGDNVPIIKGIKGVPGDTFGVSILPNGEGEFLVNGKYVENSRHETYRIPSVRASLWRLYEAEFHGVIPTDKFFVLGEIPTGSLDSSRFGFVSRDDLLGRVEQ